MAGSCWFESGNLERKSKNFVFCLAFRNKLQLVSNCTSRILLIVSGLCRKLFWRHIWTVMGNDGHFCRRSLSWLGNESFVDSPFHHLLVHLHLMGVDWSFVYSSFTKLPRMLVGRYHIGRSRMQWSWNYVWNVGMQNPWNENVPLGKCEIHQND